MSQGKPFLAHRSSAVDGDASGTTITTKAVETSDEQDPPRGSGRLGTGTGSPWLAGKSVRVTGDLSGKSIITRAQPETSDEGDDEP
jgi:hypothetical protein